MKGGRLHMCTTRANTSATKTPRGETERGYGQVRLLPRGIGVIATGES
jgi:hypothetical protein